MEAAIGSAQGLAVLPLSGDCERVKVLTASPSSSRPASPPSTRPQARGDTPSLASTRRNGPSAPTHMARDGRAGRPDDHPPAPPFLSVESVQQRAPTPTPSHTAERLPQR